NAAMARPGATALILAPERRKAGPRAGFLSVPTHRGDRLDGHLLRGGAATRTVDHCTSPPFVPIHRTGTSCDVQARLDDGFSTTIAPERQPPRCPPTTVRRPESGPLRMGSRRCPSSAAGPPCRGPDRCSVRHRP